MDKINSVAITKIEKLYQAAMNDRDSVRSFVGSEMLEDIYREQYFRAYRITHDVAQFAWETRQYRKFLRTHQQAAAPPLLPAQPETLPSRALIDELCAEVKKLGVTLKFERTEDGDWRYEIGPLSEKNRGGVGTQPTLWLAMESCLRMMNRLPNFPPKIAQPVNQPTSDPSGKGARPFLVHEARQALIARIAKYDNPADADWVLEDAPKFERHAISAMRDLLAAELDAASLRQQLSNATDKVEFLERELGNFRRNAAHRAEQLAEEKVADLRQQLSEAKIQFEEQSFELGRLQGKVSQLEADLKYQTDARSRDAKDERDNFIIWRKANHDPLLEQVSVLTKEREEIAKALMLFYHADMVEEDAAWELQMEPDSEYFATLPEACKAFYDLMDRECLKADKRLSAVSEVVRTAQESVEALRHVASALTHDASRPNTVVELRNLADAAQAALSNYEKAQQKEG